MSGTPEWKVYRDGKYVAACKFVEDAAAIVALSGGEIRNGHTAEFRCYVDPDGTRAAESLDAAASETLEKLELIKAQRRARRGRKG